jgi:hypothetical protein
MDLAELRVFLTVAAERSFSRAAANTIRSSCSSKTHSIWIG